MNFFDKLIEEAELLVPSENKKKYLYSAPLWEDIGRNEVIMLRDSAYELDGCGFNLVTSKQIENDEIIVAGEDLNEINSNSSFARVSIIQIDNVENEQAAYDLIRKIEYAKYHFFPKGYMMRTSSRSQKETVRISRTALNNGLTFEKAGSLLINKYKDNKAVKAVRVIFITDKNADFKALEALAKNNYNITETLNHIMNSVKFDCDSCNLKPICDEVDGMKELHFKNANMG